MIICFTANFHKVCVSTGCLILKWLPARDGSFPPGISTWAMDPSVEIGVIGNSGLFTCTASDLQGARNLPKIKFSKNYITGYKLIFFKLEEWFDENHNIIGFQIWYNNKGQTVPMKQNKFSWKFLFINSYFHEVGMFYFNFT